MSRAREIGGVLATAAVVAALVALAPRLADRAHAERLGGDVHERLYYPDGDVLRHASLGFRAPAADYAWLQATQYYGGFRRGEHDLRYFTGLVEATTTLDPAFTEAYHFASLVYCLDDGDAESALDVLRQGILANPDDWRLHFDVGFVNYVFLRRYDVASQWFEAAAALPGATDFCRRFAAFSRRRAGDQEGSMILWDNLRRTTDSPDMRQLAPRMGSKGRAVLAAAAPAAAAGPAGGR